jgi:hypothetical protein
MYESIPNNRYSKYSIWNLLAIKPELIVSVQHYYKSRLEVTYRYGDPVGSTEQSWARQGAIFIELGVTTEVER